MTTADLIARVRAAAHSIRSRRAHVDEADIVDIERIADALEVMALATPVAQRPTVDQQSAHEAGEREAAPEERRTDNPGQVEEEGVNRPFEPTAACVLASAPGAASVIRVANAAMKEQR